MNPNWKSVYGDNPQRFRDQELILRFIALLVDESRYGSTGERTMKDFLSSFMARHRDVSGQVAEEWRQTFASTINLIDNALGHKAFRPEKRLNTAVCDAVMVGLAHALARDVPLQVDELRSRYDILLENEDFLKAISSRTSHQPNVAMRMQLARNAFAQTPTA